MAEPQANRGFGNGKSDDYATVNVAEVRKRMQCPICRGIIRKARIVVECQHRFCRECIDEKNECPECGTHCASPRSVRDDPNFDTAISAFIPALYPELEKYEKEIAEEGRHMNGDGKQIQASTGFSNGERNRVGPSPLTHSSSDGNQEAAVMRPTIGEVPAGVFVRNAHGKHIPGLASQGFMNGDRKQTRATTAETFKFQSDAVVMRPTIGEIPAAVFVRNADGKFQNVQNRSRGPAQQTRRANNNSGDNYRRLNTYLDTMQLKSGSDAFLDLG